MEPWFADPIFSISKMRNQFEALWNWKEEKEKMELENEMKKKMSQSWEIDKLRMIPRRKYNFVW